MINPFITSFKDSDDLMHIYFCPGRSTSDVPLSKIVISGAEYRFTLKTDASVDYSILSTENSNGDFDVKITFENGNEQLYHLNINEIII